MKHRCPKKWGAFFKAAHDIHRQHILSIIKAHREVNASQILSYLKLSQPTLSHHLKILKEAGLIKAEKRGKEVVYSINSDQIHECCRGFMNRFGKRRKRRSE